jgi:hypothetical protein
MRERGFYLRLVPQRPLWYFRLGMTYSQEVTLQSQVDRLRLAYVVSVGVVRFGKFVDPPLKKNSLRSLHHNNRSNSYLVFRQRLEFLHSLHFQYPLRCWNHDGGVQRSVQ